MTRIIDHRLLFFAGILCYLYLAAGLLFDFFPENGKAMWASVTWIGVVLFHFSGMDFYTRREEPLDVESAFSKLIVLGIGVLAISLLSPFACWWFGHQTSWVHKAVGLPVVYVVLLYFQYLFFSYRRLNIRQESSDIFRQWKVWVLFLPAAMLLHFPLWPWPFFLFFTIVAAGFLYSLNFIIRVKWIAMINPKGRLLSILYILVISLIIIGLLQSLLHIHLPEIYPAEIIRNAFFLLIVGFVLLYNLFAVLTLVFNMPLASIQEQRANEIASLHAINNSMLEKEDPKETGKLLFSICFEETKSDAAFTVMHPNQLGESVFYTSRIDEADVRLLMTELDLIKRFEDRIEEPSIYFRDLYRETDLKPSTWKYQSVLVVPVYRESEPFQLLVLLKSFFDGFDDYHKSMAESFANQTRLVIEKDRLLQRTLASERASQELDIARNVQRSLMPATFPESPYYEISGFSESLFEVGGDYYDFIELSETKLAVIIADVSGSGASAAFHMAQLKGVFHSLARMDMPIESFLEYANKAVSSGLKSNMFITMIYAEFDFKKKEVIYGRAGHTPILYYSAELDQTMTIADKGMGLGLIRNDSYANHVKSYKIDLTAGDLCVLFTDGISEGRAPGNADEFYGADKMMLLTHDNADLSAAEIQEIILEDYYDFMGQEEKGDDHSLLVIKIK